MPNSVRVYPNGLPHPSMQMRRRVTLELAILTSLTILYLSFWPAHVRHMGVDIGMALVALGLVGFTMKDTRERIWGPPADAEFERLRRCTTNMLLATVPAVLAFGLFGAWDAYTTQGGWSGVTTRFLNPRFPLALFLYIPWALLQQTLFQFYLLGRLRALLPFASPLLLSTFNGIFYGAVHIPDWDLTFFTMLGGVVWSYSYHRDRYVVPIAISHAILGSTYFYWACNRDLVNNLIPLAK